MQMQDMAVDLVHNMWTTAVNIRFAVDLFDALTRVQCSVTNCRAVCFVFERARAPRLFVFW